MIEERDMTIHADKLAQALGELRSIYVPTEHTRRVCEIVDELVARKRKGVPGDHGSALIIGDSHVGKSACIQYAIKRHMSQDCSQSSILHVTLPQQASRRAMLLTLGHAIEDRGFFNPLNIRANEAQLQRAVLRALVNMQIDAVVIDEAHHIKYGNKDDAGYWLGEMIKTFLIEGPCPVILCGKAPDAKRPYLENRQLMNRTADILHIEPFDIDAAVDRSEFNRLFKKYFEELHRRGVTEEVSFLKRGEFFGAFFIATGGKVGEGVRLLEGAITRMMRAGRQRFQYKDFYDSFANLALLEEFGTPNPYAQLR
jgi:hypothetical protein